MGITNLFGAKKQRVNESLSNPKDQWVLEASSPPSRSALLSPAPLQKPNFLVQGSRLIGNVTVSSDLEISGEVQGNITAKETASICLKGACKGSIETAGGDVVLEGDLTEGNIKAGRDVSITGSFKGSSVSAQGKAYIDGEFTGTLKAKDVEVGPHARIQGEIHYSGLFSVEKGAVIGCQLIRLEPSKEASVEPLIEEAA